MIKLEKVDPKPRSGPSRHLILIRHGQYDETHREDEKRILTPLGADSSCFSNNKTFSLKTAEVLLARACRCFAPQGGSRRRLLGSGCRSWPLRACTSRQCTSVTWHAPRCDLPIVTPFYPSGTLVYSNFTLFVLCFYSTFTLFLLHFCSTFTLFFFTSHRRPLRSSRNTSQGQRRCAILSNLTNEGLKNS